MDSASISNETGRRPRPKITLQIPNYNRPDLQGTPYLQTSIPLGTAATGMSSQNLPPDYMQYMYPQRAGEFMFKGFEGFRDFTKDTAKFSFDFGEKYVLWTYHKIYKLSKNWFTHIFLTLVVLLYSVAGAYMFMSVEGKVRNKHINTS